MPMPFKGVQCPQRAVSVLPVVVTAGVSPALSGLCKNFCSVARVGVGVYDVTVMTNSPSRQVLMGEVTLMGSGVASIDAANTTALKIRVKTFAVDGTTATDINFTLVAYHCSAADLQS